MVSREYRLATGIVAVLVIVVVAVGVGTVAVARTEERIVAVKAVVTAAAAVG